MDAVTVGGRRLAICVGCAAVLTGLFVGGASAVLGGRPVSVRSAPWAVSLRAELGPGETFNCSGTILDSLHVLTAAHCLFNPSGSFERLSRLTIKAGTSDFRGAWLKDHPQVRKAASVRFYPGYVWRPSEMGAQIGKDVAVVRLDRPLNLAGKDVRAVALPPNNVRPSGDGFTLAGFGREHATNESSGALHTMTTNLIRVPYCSSARTLCGISISSSACPGDSGSGLIAPGSTPTLVGVLVTGECRAGGISGYVNVSAKRILDFVEGTSGSTRPASAPATRWAPAGWMSHPVLGRNNTILPIVVSLPRTWVTGETASGAENLWNPATTSEANISAMGKYQSRTDFFTSILAAAKLKYASQDPNADVRSRIVDLPAGRALEVIVRLTTKVDGRTWRLSVQNYNLFHNGVGYDVEYEGAPTNDAIDIPVWNRSARTLHYVGVG